MIAEIRSRTTKGFTYSRCARDKIDIFFSGKEPVSVQSTNHKKCFAVSKGARENVTLQIDPGAKVFFVDSMEKWNKQKLFRNHSTHSFEKCLDNYQSNPSCITKKLLTGCDLSDFMATFQLTYPSPRSCFLDLIVFCFMDDMWLKKDQMRKADTHCLICIRINPQTFVKHHPLFSKEHNIIGQSITECQNTRRG